MRRVATSLVLKQGRNTIAQQHFFKRVAISQEIVRPFTMTRSFSTMTMRFNEETANQQQQQQQEEKPASEANTQQASAQNKEVEELKEKLKAAEEKIKELDHKYKSSLAEAQNTRRIAKQDVDNEKKFAISKFAGNLLDVADNFERAIANVTEEDIKQIVDVVTSENSGASEELHRKARTLATIFQGIKMTENILHKTFEKFGVAKLENVVNSKFDPAFHDAIVKQPLKDGDDASKSNTVSHVLKSGYKINDRVLRPAQVVVVTDD